ncbi:hypothetical protein ABZ434_01155 [Streptomyces sp. NPDC005761]|uniref:hypothetical protein n=1 Tax=unclassified Streptomyces TaxID=2593676 RepID=UPI003400FB8F
MTLTHPPSRTGEVVDTGPGPNQWIKDHLDGLIDAQLLTDCSTAAPAAAPKSEEGLLP